MDAAGVYVIIGKKRKDFQVEAVITYLGKFSLILNGKSSSIYSTVEGKWSNLNNGAGEFIITQIKNNHNVGPFVPAQIHPKPVQYNNPSVHLYHQQNMPLNQSPYQSPNHYNDQTYLPSQPKTYRPPLHDYEPAGSNEYPTIQEIQSKPHAKGPSN